TLKNKVEADHAFAGKFTKEQLEQIKNGETPDGYTWHHNETSGKMELVRTDVHQANRHTGGKAIWGGGNENR
ncbi:MAG: HNH endonuclease, partial [Bacteroidales bacterium]